jgi:hypothetical protein
MSLGGPNTGGDYAGPEWTRSNRLASDLAARQEREEPYVVSDDRLVEIRMMLDEDHPRRGVDTYHLAGAVYDLLAERDALAAQLERERESRRAIQANAEAWHGPVTEDNRHAMSLAVIARWARDPDSIPDGVREHARAALVVPDGPQP